MSQKVGSLLPDIRAAARQHLLAIDMPLASVEGGASFADGLLTKPGAGFDAAGFCVGDYATVAGLTGITGAFRVSAVSADVIKFEGMPYTGSVAQVLISGALPDQAWQGESYEPKLGMPHLTEAVRAVASVPAADGGYTRWTLLATWTLFYPAGKGTIGIESMAGRLLEQFRPSTPMVFGQSRGKVAAVDPGPLVQEPEWLIMPVTARVTAWTDNRG